MSEGRNGIPLVHCFANCSQDEVIKALRNLYLWPQRKQRKWTPAERRAYARHMQEREDAETWAAVAQGIAEDALAAAAPNDLARGSFTKLLLVCREGGAALIEEFRDWRERCPELTAAVVHAGRISQERVQVKAARFVARGCRRAQK